MNVDNYEWTMSRVVTTLFIIFHLFAVAVKAAVPAPIRFGQQYNAASLPTWLTWIELNGDRANKAIHHSVVGSVVDAYAYLTSLRQTWQFFSPNPVHVSCNLSLRVDGSLIYDGQNTADSSNLQNWWQYYMATMIELTPKENLGKSGGLNDQLINFVHWYVSNKYPVNSRPAEVQVVFTRQLLNDPYKAASPEPMAPKREILLLVHNL